MSCELHNVVVVLRVGILTSLQDFDWQIISPSCTILIFVITVRKYVLLKFLYNM